MAHAEIKSLDKEVAKLYLACNDVDALKETISQLLAEIEKQRELLGKCEPYIEEATKDKVIWNPESIYLKNTKALLQQLKGLNDG